VERYSARVSALLRAHAWGRRYGDLALAGTFVVLAFMPGAAHQGVDLAEFTDRRPMDWLGVFLVLARAFFTAGGHLGLAYAFASLGAYVAFAVALRLAGSPETVAEYVTFGMLLAAFWGVGAWLRARVTYQAAERERTEEAVVAAERVRIARDLHDERVGGDLRAGVRPDGGFSVRARIPVAAS
jgi:signal transduction histidine kinase